jgi:hypothetical protein
MHNLTGLNQSQVPFNPVNGPYLGSPVPQPLPAASQAYAAPPIYTQPPPESQNYNAPQPQPQPQAYGTPPMYPHQRHYTSNALAQRYGGAQYGTGSPGPADRPLYHKGPMKLAPIQLNTFSGEDISKYYAFKKDFIAYIHAREDMPVEEKMVRLLSLTQGGPAYDLIVSVTRDEAGYHEALEQLDADFGNQDRQFACALGGLQDLTEITLNDHATIRAARIAIRRVVSHLKQIPGTNAM